MKQIPERDWKVLRALKDKLTERFCDHVFEQLIPIIERRTKGSYKAYLEMWKILNKEDDDFTSMFDDLKRSAAFFKLATWKKSGLLSDEDFSEFSEETQNTIALLTDI